MNGLSIAAIGMATVHFVIATKEAMELARGACDRLAWRITVVIVVVFLAGVWLDLAFAFKETP